MTMATYRRKHLMGTYNFRGWVCDHHSGENSSGQTDMALSISWKRVFPTWHEAKRVCELGITWAFEISKPNPHGTPPSTKTRPQSFPNSFTHWEPSIQTYEPMGSALIQTSTEKFMSPHSLVRAEVPHLVPHFRSCYPHLEIIICVFENWS